MFCQPVGQINIKIVFVRIRIFPCPYGQRAVHIKHQQHQALQYNDAIAQPQPKVNFIHKHRIEHIKNDPIKKHPDAGVGDFDED